MAQVFLALDTELELEVAYKRLRPHYAEDPSVVERFKREATDAATLSSHPNIVQIRDRGTTKEGAYFIVMEYVRGGTLAERIEREEGPFRPPRRPPWRYRWHGRSGRRTGAASSTGT
jgi:serine/threonine-protein kinase